MKVRVKFWDRTQISLVLAIVLVALPLGILGPSNILDSRLFYTAAEGRAVMAAKSAAELSAYFWNEIGDLALIAAYSSALIYALSGYFPSRRKAWLLGLAPACFDLVETITIIYTTSVGSLPAHFDWLGWITLGKWSSGFVGLVVLGVAATRAKDHKNENTAL